MLGNIGRRQTDRSGDDSRAINDTTLQRLATNAGAFLYRDLVWSRGQIVSGLDEDPLQGGIGAGKEEIKPPASILEGLESKITESGLRVFHGFLPQNNR
jgi:hypothetical protein